MKFFNINHTTYACNIHQNDSNLPYLLMLHGFMGDHRVFDHLIDDLQTFCNPVAIDLLGYGQSSKPEDPKRYDEHLQVEDILGLTQKLKIAPVFLFGYSMGGRLALKTALSASQMFDGLILESTTCGITAEEERKERRVTDEQGSQQIENNYGEFLAKWQNILLFQSPLPANKKLTHNYRKVQGSQSPKALAASLSGFSTGSMVPVCDQLKDFDLPVLLMAGSEDEKYQRINNHMAKQFPNATFSSIKAGHRIHLDNPNEFIQEINYYFSKI